ncbi:vacuolar sorting protein VPS33/slp1 [Thoreauomyces humboldtii]|nr:vacuolar sorting protein VPS33/slp1 [Thoreauomyces humboldtii]
MTSLKDIMKKRILDDMIRSVQPANRWKIIVVDPKSIKILNNACRMHDILEENVTLVEDITRKRQPYPGKEAIYFISPNETCIQRLIDDFPAQPPPGKEAKKGETAGPRMYAVGHIFFTSALSDALFNKIKASPAIGYIKTLKEMNVDFLAYESQVFTFDQPNSALPLYSPIREGSRHNEISQIAKKIASTLATLGEYPYIRYYASPTSTVPAIPLYVAQAVKSELDELARQDTDFPPASSPYKRSVLIITDRTLDMISPIVHEFTYQAMMNDLLVLKDGKYIYKPDPGDLPSAAEADALQTKNVSASLDENDPIWMLIRHWHYADAVEYIRTTFNKFLTENRAASSAMEREGGGAEPSGGIESLKHMKETLSSLPQFQEMKGKDLATGETSKGRAIKFTQTMIDMVPALDSPTVTSTDKLRLLMLYIIAQNGIEDDERRRLLGYAKLSLEESQAITNLSYWGVRMGKEKGEKDAKGKYAYHVHGKKRTKGEDGEAFDLSRWTPVLKSVLEDQISNQLDTTLFPWLTEPAPDSPRSAPTHIKAPAAGGVLSSKATGLWAPDPNFPTSLRTTRASWAPKRRAAGDEKAKNSSSDANAGGGHAASGEPASSQSDIRKNGPRVIVFTLGGVTFSELRTVYAVRGAFQRDVLLGSTHVTAPLQWIDFLKQMGKVDVTTADEQREAGSPAAPSPGAVTAGAQDSLKRSETTGSLKKEEKGLRGMFGKKKKNKENET